MTDETAELFNRPDRSFQRAKWIEQRIAAGATQGEIAMELRYEAEKWDIHRDFSKTSVSAHHGAWLAIEGAGLEPDAELFSAAFRVTSTGGTASRRDEVVRETRRLATRERKSAFLRGMAQIVERAREEVLSDSAFKEVLASIEGLRGRPLTRADHERLRRAVASLIRPGN